MKAKVKVIALAVFGVLATASAQAQTSNVSLYGRIHMDVDFISSATDESLGKLNRVSSNLSRIGFKGSESLGGGQSVIFQIESHFNGDSGGGELATRDTWLGLQGDWGSVKLGRMLTPYDKASPMFGNAPTYTTSILYTAALWAQGNMGKDAGGFDARLGNSVRYDSPKFSNTSVSAQYTTDEKSSHGWVGSAGVYYDNAGLQLATVYETNQDWRSYASTPGSTTQVSDQAFSVLAAYNFGIIRPAVVYEHIEYEANANKDKLKRDFYGASLTAPIGKGTLYAFYGYADDGKGDGLAVGNVRGGKDTKAQQYEISYSYPLSKRTVTYLGYVMIDNDQNATYTFGNNGNTYRDPVSGITATGAKPGVSQQGIILGAVHFF